MFCAAGTRDCRGYSPRRDGSAGGAGLLQRGDADCLTERDRALAHALDRVLLEADHALALSGLLDRGRRVALEHHLANLIVDHQHLEQPDAAAMAGAAATFAADGVVTVERFDLLSTETCFAHRLLVDP